MNKKRGSAERSCVLIAGMVAVADIVSLEPTGDPVENRLAVDVQDGVVSFFINDAVVAELPGAGLPTDGGIGIAAGGDLSLHVTELRIGPNHPAG